MSKLAARGDKVDKVKTNHDCTAETTTDQCSPSVFAMSVGIVRLGDLCAEHTIKVGKSCVPHKVPLTSSSSSVIINGKGAGRKGDKYDQTEEIITGAESVLIGD